MTGKPHFLSTVCYKAEEDGTRVIIDGQQRLTCLSLLLKALYDISDSNSLRTEIQDNYLLNPCQNGSMKLKLKPIQKDSGAYKKLLSHYRVDMDSFSDKEKESFLFQAFFNFRVWMNEMSEIDNFETKLFDAINNMEIVEIIVTSENPQEIFESLNATGLSLTSTDILRNYLLMQIPYKEQVRLYNTYWLPMEEMVTIDEIQDFVASYVVTKRMSDEININGKRWKVNSGNICSTFRAAFSDLETTEKLETLFEDMMKYAGYYKHIVFDKNVNYADLSEIDALLYDLLIVLKDTRFKPLIMYLFNDMAEGKLNAKEMCEVLKYMISYAFRGRVCNLSGFSNYQFSGFIMTRLADADSSEPYVKTFMKAIGAGHGRYSFPTDIIFEHSLLGNEFAGLNIGMKKYCLYSIEKHLNPSQQAAFSGGTIEHIMPQTLTEFWEKYLAFNGDAGIHEEKLNYLGNLTLTESNSTISNKPFDEKKHYYMESIYEITKRVTDYPKWTSKAIDERAKKLAKTALDIWPGINLMNEEEVAENRYTLNDDLNKVTATPPTSFGFLGEEVPVNNWMALGVGVVSILNTVVPDKLRELIDHAPDEISGLLSREPDYKRQPTKITGDLWLNQVKRPASLLRQLRDLLTICSDPEYSLCDELWFTVYQEYDDTIVLS